tara:strand:- start:2747 stop:3352 length:606 start_codon:yes stop_codon:yes gene_type:complete
MKYKRKVSNGQFKPFKESLILKGDEFVEDKEFGYFVGYAAKFNNVDRVNDRILPGAFKSWIEENGDTIKLQYNHRDTLGIAKIREDGSGLVASGMIDITVNEGYKAYRMLKMGAIDKMSFAYDVLESEDAKHNGQIVTNLKTLRPYEVSIVDFPANESASILEVKSYLEELNKKDEENSPELVKFIQNTKIITAKLLEVSK